MSKHIIKDKTDLLMTQKRTLTKLTVESHTYGVGIRPEDAENTPKKVHLSTDSPALHSLPLSELGQTLQLGT